MEKPIEEETINTEKPNSKRPFSIVKVSGGVKINFWKNAVEKNGRKWNMLNPTITKNYKDTKGEWQRQSVSLNMNDLYRLFSVLPQIKEIEDKFKEEERNNGLSEDKIKEVMQNKDVTRDGAIALIKANAI